jgi:hypothetical protein
MAIILHVLHLNPRVAWDFWPLFFFVMNEPYMDSLGTTNLFKFGFEFVEIFKFQSCSPVLIQK